MKAFYVFGRLGSLAALLSLLAMVSLAACGDDDDDAAGGTATAAGSPTAAASPTVAASPSPAAYPVTVTDLLGRKVEIKARPATVVALSPTAAEFVFAAGGMIAGRASSVVYPEAAKAVPEVGTAYQPNFEAILALKPDLVVADSVIHAAPTLKKPIEDLGVPVIFAGADSVKGVLDGLALVGKVFNAEQKTSALATEVTKARDAAKAAIAAKSPSAVVLISDRDQVLYAAKHASYAGDIMKELGIQNPAAALPDAGPFPGYTTLSTEKLLEFSPAIVFTITPAPPPAPRLSEVLGRFLPPKPGQKIVELDVNLFLQAPGPRIIDAFKAISTAVAGGS